MINKEALDFAMKFGNSELMAMFEHAEKNKWFGVLYHHPNKKAEAEFIFQKGICLRVIEPIYGKNGNTFNKSTKFVQ